LVDKSIVVLGEADRASAEKVKRYFASRERALRPFTVDLDLMTPGEEIEGISLADANQENCQEAFRRIMARNVINFGTGSAAIAAASKPVLDRLAAVARRCDGYSIEVAGHTDDVGGRETNMSLSRDRAQAVVNYLAEQGVVSRRMQAIGYGPDKPIAANTSVQGQARNRRIEFTVQL
jgi:OOP family OmpA-OmpF porin